MAAFDPNELIGPAGYGSANYVKGDGTFAYRIGFENASNATAPAQVVVVTNTIATNLDLATLEFTSVGFGDYFFAIPSGSQHYEHTESIEFDGTTFDVNIAVNVDTITRQVRARFDSLMPESGLPPAAEIGFLPPEDGTYRGMGHVAYVIRPVSGLPTDTGIRNIGTITFDPLAGGPTFRTDLVDPFNPNSGIDSNRQALVTIDTNLPISTVTGPSGTATNTSFVVTWSGSDVGAGVTSYDLFVQTNGGAWQQWLSFTTNNSAIFGGYPNQTYGFYGIARDGAGNVEAKSPGAEVSATAPADGAPVIDPVGDRSLVVGQQLVITNVAFDPDTPLAFSLVSAPTGMTISTNGVLRWTPGCIQGSTTNIVTIQVTDSANPPQSSTMTFAVTVSECVQVLIGTTVMQINHTDRIPVNVISTVGLTNLSFGLGHTAGRLTNWTLNATNSVVSTGYVQSASAALASLTIATATTQPLQGSTALGWIYFDAVAAPSAFVPLSVTNVIGQKLDGSLVGGSGNISRVVVIGAEPLVEAWLTNDSQRMLTLFGNPGASYLTESKTNFSLGNWQPGWRVPMSNLYEHFPVSIQPSQLYYRAHEFFADPPIVELAPQSNGGLSLLLYGKAGTNYVIQTTTNLLMPNSWTASTNVGLTNSFRSIAPGAPTNSMNFFRALRPAP